VVARHAPMLMPPCWLPGLASGDGLTVSGTTLVAQTVSSTRPNQPLVSAHRLINAGLWGASNSGGGVLRQFFSDPAAGRSYSRPDRPQPAERPPAPAAAGRGERFPRSDDPDRQPVLVPGL